jgi:hypothetical protein
MEDNKLEERFKAMAQALGVYRAKRLLDITIGQVEENIGVVSTETLPQVEGAVGSQIIAPAALPMPEFGAARIRKKQKRVLSEEARQKIAEAQKRRWAKQKRKKTTNAV